MLREVSDRILQVEGKGAFWYGFAYRKPELRVSIFAPIPLNFLIGWAHRYFWRLIHGPRDPHSELVDALINSEFRAGYRLGVEHTRKELGIEMATLIGRYDR